MSDEPVVTATYLSASAGSVASATSTTPSWLSSLTTSSIQSDMVAADVNGVVTAQGLTTLLTDLDAKLSSSTLTSAEFKDLQSIASNLNNGLSTSSYLTYAFKALVNGNAANAYWTGGGSSAVALGNLAAGATQTQLGELIGKWFLGTDLPSSYVNMNDGNPFTVSYTTVTNKLFGASGPSMNDINQGDLGDCYFEASCAEVADMNSSCIESMFTNNGNGTYGVRFYFDGVAEYVTVNLSLADGGQAFNHATDIWASLAEKAFAQFQAINVDTGNVYNYGNSWSTTGNGGDMGHALEALTGASVITEFDANGASWDSEKWNSSLNWTGYSATGLTSSSVLAAIETAIVDHDDVDLASETDAYDASGKQTLVASHVLSIYGYDSATNMLEVRNPWGSEAGQYWDTTFEVSVATLLADGDQLEFDNVGGSSALPNSTTVLNYLNNISAYDQFASQFKISDTAANVAASFDALNADSHIASITLTDSGTPTLSLRATQFASDTTALGNISNSLFEVQVGTAANFFAGGNGAAGTDITLTANQAALTVKANSHVDLTGSNDSITMGAGSNFGLKGSGNTVAMTAFDSLWLTGGTGETFTGSGFTVYGASGAGFSLGGNGSGGTADNVNGAGLTIALQGNSRFNLTGSNDTVTLGANSCAGLSGADDTFTATTGDGVWLIAGSGDKFTGSGFAIYGASGTSFTLGGNGATGAADTIDGSGVGVALMANSRANLIGDDNSFALAGGSNAGLTGSNDAVTATADDGIWLTAGTGDVFTGAGFTINGATGVGLTLGGNGASGAVNSLNGSGMTVALQANSRANVTGSNNALAIGSVSNVGLNGSNDTVAATSGDGVWLVGGGADTLTGSGFSVYASVGVGLTVGGNGAWGTDIYVNGSGVSAALQANSRMDVTGSSDAVTMGVGSNMGLTGSNDSLTATNYDSIWLVGGTGNTVTGSHFTVYGGASSSVTLKGTAETFHAGMNDALTDQASGTTIDIGGAVGALTIANFGSDTAGVIDLLNGVGAYSTAAATVSALTSDGAGGSLLSLGGNGSIDFVGVAAYHLSAANFKIG